MTVTLPRPSELPRFAPLTFTRATLGNGIDVLLARKPNLPIFDFQLIVRGGGAIDAPRQAGRASLTAEMLDEGTTRRSALEISAHVEQMGADLEVRAGWDACLFSMHALSPRLCDSIELVAELALQPTFPAEEYKRKHEERLHALQQEQDEPRTVAVKALARAIFGDDHVFGRPLGGTPASVAGLQLGDLEASYRATFAPDRAHLVLVGDFNEDDALASLERSFGGWRSASLMSQPSAPGKAGRPGLYLIDRPGAAQSEIRFGHIGVARDTTDYFPLIVLNTILGGSFKSRLNMKLREEKGFTYGANTFFAFRRSGGAFGGGAAVFTEATGETVELSVGEIRRMADGGVTTEELNRARNYLSLGFMRNFETTGDIAGHLSEVALYDLAADHLATYSEQVGAVTAQQIAEAAGKYLRAEELAVVVVGDRERVLPQLLQLELGPITEWGVE